MCDFAVHKRCAKKVSFHCHGQTLPSDVIVSACPSIVNMGRLVYETSTHNAVVVCRVAVLINERK